jgi:hypothetical protein
MIYFKLAQPIGKRGKILGWYRGPFPVIYVTDPDFLKEVLIKDSENFIDRPMIDRSDNIPHLIMLKGNTEIFNRRRCRVSLGWYGIS